MEPVLSTGEYVAICGTKVRWWNARWNANDWGMYRSGRARGRTFAQLRRSVAACRANAMKRLGASVDQPELKKIGSMVDVRIEMRILRDRISTSGAIGIFSHKGFSIADEAADHNDWSFERKIWAKRKQTYADLFLKFRGFKR